MLLSDKMAADEMVYFVGRNDELDRLRHHAEGQTNRQWLHFYGPGGIGKSTLLQRFRYDSGPSRSFMLDGGREIRKPGDVLARLAEQLAQGGEPLPALADEEAVILSINRQAIGSDTPILFLLDTFESMRPLEEWLSEFLIRLDTSVRVVSAGRHPLTGGWRRSGWLDFIQEIQLPALPAAEVERYASKRGIASSSLQSRLFRFSGGYPLAMALAAEVMLRGDDPVRNDQGVQDRLIGVLMEELLRGVNAPVQKLFEAATVYWRFNEERLLSLLEAEIPTDAFREFVRLPFVIRAEQDWMLHETVRGWALEDLNSRKPVTLERMRRKALEQILAEERTNPRLRPKLHLDKMNLHEHPFVRETFFSGHLDHVEMRACRECDLPAVEALYLRYLHFAAPEKEESHMSWLLRPVWEAAPSFFVTFWQHEEMIAFYAMIPLQEEILKLFDREPLLQPFVSQWNPVPGAYFLSFMGMIPEIEVKTRAYFLNTMIDHFDAADWIIDFTCLQEWFPVFEHCGFERAAWADARTPLGTEYRAFTIDLSKEDFLTKLDRSLTGRPGGEMPDRQEPDMDLPALKSLLKRWHEFTHHPECVEVYARLFPHRVARKTTESVEAIRRDILQAIDKLLGGGNREALMGKILKYAYTTENRTHEQIAERLNLSMATYYRQLNKALARLFTLLSRPD